MDHLLDYRGATTAEDFRVRKIVAALSEREAAFYARITGKIILGGLASIWMPSLTVALVIYFAQGQAFWRVDSHAYFSLDTVVWLAVFIGSYWYEWHTRGRFVQNSLDEGVLGDGSGPSSYGEWQYNATAIETVIWIECLLLGPRITISGIKQLREKRRLGRVSREQAAEVLEKLLATDHGLNPRELQPVIPDIKALRRAINYLLLHDWIDLSKNQMRIWALSRTREILKRGAA